ncbi:MAG: phosphoribosylanthranilate isomerase [Chthoniobacterales bacterium]
MKAEEGHDALFLSGETRVKICGVTNEEDAAMAVDLGADAIGINLFAGSKRFVELASVREWVADIRATRVAVVVNATSADLTAIEEAGCFDAVQFHGDESPGTCAAHGGRWIRAVRVRDWATLDAAANAYLTPWLLLDAFSKSGYGGTGEGVDLRLAEEFVRKERDRRVILAGGLTPETVAEAVRVVRPHAVDVASGVEVVGDPRRKDREQVRAFVEAAKSG